MVDKKKEITVEKKESIIPVTVKRCANSRCLHSVKDHPVEKCTVQDCSCKGNMGFVTRALKEKK